MKYIGWAVVVFFILGSFNLIDFHTCIAGAGECQCLRSQT